MKKINDWFSSGLIAGTLGGITHLLYNSLLLMLGLQHKTFWHAMAGLFYNQQLLMTVGAQIHGMVDAIGVSAANGILLSLILMLTGKDYLYAKSITMSAAGGYFLFIVVFPQTGLGKDSPFVPWIAIIGFIVFNGLLVGYVLNQISTYKVPNKR
ncbi:MAG: hypothetical protein FNP40_13570 [Dehalobacter sp. 4CP]|uniref:hypothetical protein n=1 Tax=Dehalobacter sp. CP TaxID=2594474 RepID=UPI0013C9A3F5|nr:hypothetical protein [Dehalobacter sp. 4CP]